MKSSKTESAKYSQKKGALPLGETGPLFPRLHVSETEKAGPRAPPRNKMALFKQFTVPSHRFVQPSRTSTATSNQQQQFMPDDCQHRYLSYYMPSLAPYSIVNQGAPSHSQPSHDISSCVTSSGSTSVADEESQRASRSLTVEMPVGVLRLTRKEDGSALLEQKAKAASNDNIPTEDLLRAEVKDVQGVHITTSVESIGRPIITSFMNSRQESMSIVEEVSTCPVVESHNCGDQEKAELTGSTKVIDNVHLKGVALQSSAEVLDEHNQGCLTSCEQSVYIAALTRPGKTLSEDELLHVDELAEGGENNDLWASKERSMAIEEQIPLPFGRSPIDNVQTTSKNQELSGPPHISKDTQEKCPSDGEKGDGGANGLSADSSLKDKGESIGESQNNQISSNEASDLSQHGTGFRRGSNGSSSSVLAAQAIRPNDVIRAVGQQQFWKARKALLRQQRIFSDQVFQLHKLIKVQQLLAEMPGTLIDEEMSFGAMDECAGAASPSHRNIREREQGCGEKAHNTGSGFEERVKGQASERVTQLEVMQQPESFAAVGNDGRGSKLYLPTFSPDGISAWGYPSLGMGQWMGPLAAQGRPSAYQPFAGSFASGAPYGGRYGSAMLGPVSLMVPLGEETSSNHGPTARPNHQAAPAMCHTPKYMANDLSGAWHYMQFNNLYYNQRSYSGTSEKDVPTGSGASINNQRPGKTVRSSGMQHPWDEASHAGRLNTNGLGNAVQHGENSSPCAAVGSKFIASTCMPSTPVSRKTNSQHQEVRQQPAHNINNGVFQTLSFEHYEANNAGAKEEAKTAAMRWLKLEQGNQVPFSNGHSEETFVDCSSDDTGNALDLFPLVPSLSPNEQSGSKQGREHWQGRVIKAVPHPAVAASQSAAGILLSLQRERKH